MITEPRMNETHHKKVYIQMLRRKFNCRRKYEKCFTCLSMRIDFYLFFTLHCPQPSHIVIVVLCSPAFTESLLSSVLQPPQSPCCPVFSSLHRVIVVLYSPASTESLLSSVLQHSQSPCCPLFSSLHTVPVVLCSPASTQSLLSSVLQPPLSSSSSFQVTLCS